MFSPASLAGNLSQSVFVPCCRFVCFATVYLCLLWLSGLFPYQSPDPNVFSGPADTYLSVLASPLQEICVSLFLLSDRVLFCGAVRNFGTLVSGFGQ